MTHHRTGTHLGTIVLAGALVASACTGDDDVSVPATTATTTTEAPASTAPAATTTTAAPTTTSVPAAPPAGLRKVEPFAPYQWVPPLDDSATYGGPATPTSMDDVLLVDSQAALAEPGDLRTMLEAQGFAVEPSEWARFFHTVYEGASYDYQPLFVTTDAAYHSWHLVFDRVLRDTEEDVLLPVLERLLTTAVAAARDQEAQLAGTPLEDAAHRATAYYESAAVLAGLDVGPVSDLTTAEVDLAREAAELTTSPVTGLVECQLPDSFVGCVDFGLFRPRGHYTRTPELERYFRGMSMLGQEGFALAEGIGVVPGLLTTRVLVTDPDLLEDWAAIYEPTAFLVGLADDIAPTEAAAAADQLAPGWREDPAVLATVDAEAVTDAVLAGHPVAIDPERAGIRLMGARFVLDSFVLDQVAWPNVGTEDERRVFVSPLDLAASFGSALSRSLQLETESRWLHYEEQLDKMTALVAEREPDDWAGTVYDAWLIAIGAQYEPRGAAYPDFMRTAAWEAKSLQTGLASYTELKHDTILYAKQGTAGEGEGPPPPPFEPRHWVEPDPVAFGRISAAARLLQDGMSERGLLTAETDDLLSTLVELTDWLAGIATRELAGDVATDAENERLARVGSELEYLWFASAELPLSDAGMPVPGEDERAALVADIFTSSFEYLELGTGWVDTIHVIVPLGDGRFEVATGAVSSYYEFWRPTSEPRLTDTEWHAVLDAGEQPARPAWQGSFLVGADLTDGVAVHPE